MKGSEQNMFSRFEGFNLSRFDLTWFYCRYMNTCFTKKKAFPNNYCCQLSAVIKSKRLRRRNDCLNVSKQRFIVEFIIFAQVCVVRCDTFK